MAAAIERRKDVSRRSAAVSVSNETMAKLEDDVRVLTRTTARLEGQVETLQATLLLLPRRQYDSAALLCKEYWMLFHHGYAAHDRELAAKQARMCYAVMCEDAMIGNHSVGPAGMLRQWMRWGSSFHNFRKDLHNIDVIHCEPTCIVRMRGTLFVRIMRHTIEQLYPHVLANEPMVQLVIGVELAVPLQVDYIMDTRCSRIQHAVASVDFAQAFHVALGNLPITNAIIAHSLIQPSGEIPVTCGLENQDSR
ncbi:hypothetical protein DYB25_014349 [Aphanomyces astaci]|uniref:Uncharacterized protein n=2 Tax=Aphanomyces astaci TaxID=112090 RepID=A0A397C3Q2_APHAT|nr:hypothetical protein DYB25_014349 [Aphanomyces astaci]